MLLQAIFINGVHELFKGGCITDISSGKKCSGNLFYSINPSFFEKYKNTNWSKPLWSCIKCQSSIWSIITFWPVVIYLFGFHIWEIPVWIFDSCSLVFLNYYWYKKL